MSTPRPPASTPPSTNRGPWLVYGIVLGVAIVALGGLYLSRTGDEGADRTDAAHLPAPRSGDRDTAALPEGETAPAPTSPAGVASPAPTAAPPAPPAPSPTAPVTPDGRGFALPSRASSDATQRLSRIPPLREGLPSRQQWQRGGLRMSSDAGSP